MKKKYLLIISLVILIGIIFSFNYYRNYKESFNSTIELLGFDRPPAYRTITAKMICEDANCYGIFEDNYFLNKCSELWNSTGYGKSDSGTFSYYYTGIFDCGNKNYIYYYRIPEKRIKIAQISETIFFQE